MSPLKETFHVYNDATETLAMFNSLDEAIEYRSKASEDTWIDVWLGDVKLYDVEEW